MNSQKLSEEQLNDLVDRFFREFESKHGANTSELDKHEFLLTNRGSFAKESKLNSMKTTKAADGQIVQVHSSSYAIAVETLKQRGFVKTAQSGPLAFTLSLQGYEQGRQRSLQLSPSFWQKLQKTLNDHRGLIAIITTIIGIIGPITKWWFSKDGP